jgi:hypothetical protein
MTDWTPPVPGQPNMAPPPSPPVFAAPPVPPAPPVFAAPPVFGAPPVLPAPPSLAAPALPAPPTHAGTYPALAAPMPAAANLPAPFMAAPQSPNSWAPQPAQIHTMQPVQTMQPTQQNPSFAPQPVASWGNVASPHAYVEQSWASAAIGGPSAINIEHVVFDGQARELAFQAPADVYTNAATGSKRKKIAALGAAIVLLAGGGATAMALRAANDGGGAATPDKAVTTMLAALEKGDILGAVDTFPANERSIARQLANDWSKQFTRLSGQPKQVDLNRVDGFGLKLEGVTTVDESVNADIVNVMVNVEKASLVGANGSSPFGGLTDAFVPGASSEDSSDGSGDGSSDGTDQSSGSDLGGAHGIITTVHDAEGWHPSLMYTAFDSIRRSKEADKPTAADAIKARGSATPEEAVADMVNALGAQDQMRIIELLPPTEWAAAHAYGKVLVNDQTAVDDPYQSTVSFSDMKFEAKSVDGGKKLIPTSFKAHNQPGSETGDEPDDVTVTKKGTDCVRIQLANAGTDETHCIDEIDKRINDNSDVSEAMIDVAKRLALKYGEIGFIVVQEGGEWYVSPIQTVNDTMLTFVSAINKNDIDTIGSFYGEMLGGMFGGSSDSSYTDDSSTDDSYGDDSYTPPPVGLSNSAQDKAAQVSLRVMLTNAKAIYGDVGNYSSAGAADLVDLEPGYTVVGASTSSTGPRDISVSITETSWTGAARSGSGTCFFISDSDEKGTLFGRIQASAGEPCTALVPFEPTNGS